MMLLEITAKPPHLLFYLFLPSAKLKKTADRDMKKEENATGLQEPKKGSSVSGEGCPNSRKGRKNITL